MPPAQQKSILINFVSISHRIKRNFEFHSVQESNKVLSDCNNLLTFFGSLKNPLLEEKQATLVRLKQDWADFRKKVEYSEVGTRRFLIFDSFSERTTYQNDVIDSYYVAAKDNETMKRNIAELKQQLSTVREQKFALIEEYNELRKRDQAADNELVVKFVVMKIENDKKMEEVCTDRYKNKQNM